ncbi:MAG: hypothetical protein M0Z55_09850, partial [Peptococcaceae bacterium]|nr:hypothetical protein [Peptococcaceae bacterium]
VKFLVKDYKGNLLNNVKGEVEFSTTFGNVAKQRVALQNGVASVMLTSEYLPTPAVANVTGKIVDSDIQANIGLTATTSVAMGMDFTPVTKPVLSAAESNQADRLTAYFNQPVDIKYFLDANGGFNSGIKFEVFTQALGKCYPVDVVGAMPVTGESRALTLILRTPLIDNDNVSVKLTDSTGDGVLASKAPLFTLTDARPPAMIDAQAGTDMRTVNIYFSEAVDPLSARTFKNWSIDGVKLDPSKYSISVGGFTPSATGGVDQRNVVTLQKKITGEVYEDPFWKGAWFNAGKHSVQGSQVGDWAYQTDPHNIAATQIFDFTVKADPTIPVATISEQSPEQWLVQFNVPVLQDAAMAANAFKLQVLDAATNHWQDVNAEFTADKTNLAGFKVLVTEMDNNKFLLELTQDWTTYYDALGQNTKDYYSNKYRVIVNDHAFRNPANGLVSDAQALGLEDAVMQSIDVTSPTIASIEEVTPGYLYTVVMSEPVKLRTADNEQGFNDEGLTPGRQQDDGLPVSMAQFVNGTTTIAATMSMANSGTYDNAIIVKPAEPLGDGTWKLVVKAVSDDVGNTSATVTKDFTVSIPKEFKVAFAFASIDRGLKVQSLDLWDGDLQNDYIYVKFTRPIAITGGEANVLNTANYTLHGLALADGSEIFADIQRYDNNDDVVDSITIRIPQGANALLKTITGAEFNSPNVLKLAPSLTASDGQQISGSLELRLPYNIKNGTRLGVNTNS